MDTGRGQATGLEKHTEMILRAYSIKKNSRYEENSQNHYKRASEPPSENEAILARCGWLEYRRNIRMGEQDEAGPRRVGKCNES